MNTLTQELLKAHYTYCPIDGTFTRLIANSNNSRLGDIAGYYDNGYLKISINGKQYKGHRLAFLYMTGSMPTNVDHIDGNPSNNSWTNLREASTLENQRNAKLRSDSRTGVKGVSLKGKNYYGQINIDGKRLSKLFSISKYGSEVEALEAARKWIETLREEEHKEFSRHC
jgi:hypothetical protein